jgi:AcrR family transcriptional regulator
MSKSKDINTETNILNAAKRIFQQKGMIGARMQEIADEAGINKALLHYYFRSKQLLFEAVFKNAFSLIAPELNEIMNSNDSVFDKITNFCYNYISFVSKHPYLPNFIIQEMNRNDEFVNQLLSEKKFPSIAKFKSQVEEKVADGIIKPITAEQLFINIMALNMFPFVASPLLKRVLKTSDEEYQTLLKNRKIEVANFIINAIKNNE